MNISNNNIVSTVIYAIAFLIAVFYVFSFADDYFWAQRKMIETEAIGQCADIAMEKKTNAEGTVIETFFNHSVFNMCIDRKGF
jgi:hypothetical protein